MTANLSKHFLQFLPFLHKNCVSICICKNDHYSNLFKRVVQNMPGFWIHRNLNGNHFWKKKDFLVIFFVEKEFCTVFWGFLKLVKIRIGLSDHIHQSLSSIRAPTVDQLTLILTSLATHMSSQVKFNSAQCSERNQNVQKVLYQRN